MRHWERSLLLALTLVVLALLARVSLEPAAIARDDSDQGEHAIAVCAIPSIVNQLMASERFAPERENLLPDLREEIEELRDELEDLRDRLTGASPEDPEAQRDARRFRDAGRELQAAEARLFRAIEVRTAEQLAECWTLAKSSASAIAEDLGFDYAIATGDPDEQLNTTDSEVTLRQITARPVIRFPKGVDITEDVRDDLNLE